MPYFKYSPEPIQLLQRIDFYWEVPSKERVCEADDAATTTSSVDNGNAASMSGDKGETSSYKTKYEKLPYSLKSCLDYCAFLECTDPYNYIYSGNLMDRETVVRLMMAEGLIEDKAGGRDASTLEDIASSFIDELLSLGMLIQTTGYEVGRLTVPEPYRGLCVVDGNKKDFDARNVDSPIRARIYAHDDAEISHHLKKLPIQFLFVVWNNKPSQGIIDTIYGLRSLLVLAFRSFTDDFLLTELGEHVNLRFLSWGFPLSKRTLSTLGNYPHLQTLDSSFLYVVPAEVLHIKTLRHLATVDARCDNIGELSSLTQLRSLRVGFVAHENIDELLKTIMSMKNLTSLSMQAEKFFYEDEFIDVFPLLEPFSPPPFLQELRLDGKLIELPIWTADLKNLISLKLMFSNLTDISSAILQYLPKLKHLRLYYAYEAELIGKDFCTAKGFPKLETLEIRSRFLVEWIEIAVGGFPCLKSLLFYDCGNLMFLPEGLQHVSTLQKMSIEPGHGDLIRRLNGDENYKIKHIPSVEMREMTYESDSSIAFY